MCVCVFTGTLQPVSPWRWLFSILVPLVLTVRALKKRSLSRSGALGGESTSSASLMSCSDLSTVRYERRTTLASAGLFCICNIIVCFLSQFFTFSVTLDAITWTIFLPSVCNPSGSDLNCLHGHRLKLSCPEDSKLNITYFVFPPAVKHPICSNQTEENI